ncbi:MAG TPA: hypothetical protein PKI55_10245 [Chitinophagaceae bacterium]|nr:hypothetical protein [Chitinophagaceae bacterium]
MNHLYNDQAYIAEAFQLDSDYILQASRLAFFKINSYKLSLINASFCATREELKNSINSSLLNYTCPALILADLGFFKGETEN